MDLLPPPVHLPPIPPDATASDAFLHVLQYIIGLNTPAKRDHVTRNGGVTTIDDLLMVDMESLLDCLSDNTSIMAKTCLKTFKMWAKESYDINHAVNIRDFTMDVCRTNQMKIAKTTSKTKSSGTDGVSSSKEKLRSFNGKRENWTNSKRELTAYLNQLHNEAGVPLYYVIRDPDNEEEYRLHNGETGNKIYDAPFIGRIYDDDAFRVLQILRLWTSNGTAQTYVDQTNDVQIAWHNLITIYEGHDARNSNITRARSIISKSVWSRNTPNYSFDDYCNKHIQQNNELNRYNANVDGVSQVRSFLDGIKAGDRNTTIPAIKVNIETNPNLKSDLLQAIITFKDCLRNHTNTADYKDTRYIGATYWGGGRSGRGGRHGGRGGRHGGRGGRGYGGRSGRGGRGYLGRHNYNYNSESNNTQSNKEGIFIPPDVLESVPRQYHSMLYKGRDQLEIESGNIHASRKNNNNNKNNEQRTTSRVEVLDDNDEQFKNDNTEDNNDASNASSKFGATGRNNKKARIGAIISSVRRISKANGNIHAQPDYTLRERAEN